MRKRVAVIGAGPGGLATAILLKSAGFEVQVFEAQSCTGGRNASIKMGSFTFDAGPTFFLMPEILEQIFEKAGARLSDYLTLTCLDPMYRLDFGDGVSLHPTGDVNRMRQEIARFSEKDADAYEAFYQQQCAKFRAISPFLKSPVMSAKDLFGMRSHLFSAIKFINLGSVYDELARHFSDDRIRLAFTFQSKYLGMSPFKCNSLFTILSHIEHAFGVWHPRGGCHQISQAMTKLFLDLGGELQLETAVTRCEVKGTKVTAVQWIDAGGKNRKDSFDYVVMNADFSHGMSRLFRNEDRSKYRDEKLESLKYSCSTFMLYLGLDRVLPLEHHGIYFSRDYQKNLKEITEWKRIPQDPSFYLHNPSPIDATLAPEGGSALYVLVPVPNLEADIDWKAQKGAYRKRILRLIAERTGFELEPHVVVEKIVTPEDWANDFRVYRGATFSLAHSFDQLSYFRPHNRSEEFSNLYIVGGGTHPGSGLPTILQSSLIASELVQGDHEKALRLSSVAVREGYWRKQRRGYEPTV